MDIDKTVGDSGTSGGAVAGTLSSSRSIKMRRKLKSCLIEFLFVFANPLLSY